MVSQDKTHLLDMQHVYTPVFGPIPLYSILPQAKLSSFGIGFSTQVEVNENLKGQATGHGACKHCSEKKK